MVNLNDLGGRLPGPGGDFSPTLEGDEGGGEEAFGGDGVCDLHIAAKGEEDSASSKEDLEQVEDHDWFLVVLG